MRFQANVVPRPAEQRNAFDNLINSKADPLSLDLVAVSHRRGGQLHKVRLRVGSTGAPTDPTNLILLCDKHHRLVHEASLRGFQGGEGRNVFLYEERPEFVGPAVRRNEVVSFVQAGLRDLSISRAAAIWGVPIPWDPSHITYVWVDALLNYARSYYNRAAAE